MRKPGLLGGIATVLVIGVLAALGAGAGSFLALRLADEDPSSTDAVQGFASGSSDQALLSESLRMSNSRIAELTSDQTRLLSRVKSLEEERSLLMKDREEAGARREEAERETMALRDVLLEEELRYRAIIQGLRRWKALPEATRDSTARPDDPTELSPTGREAVLTRAEPDQPSAGGGSIESEPPLPDEVPAPQTNQREKSMEGAAGIELLNGLLQEATSANRFRLRDLAEVSGGVLRKVVFEQIVQDPERVQRTFIAEEGQLFLGEEKNEVVILLARGKVVESGLTIPFFNDQYRLVVPGFPVDKLREVAPEMIREP